MKITAPQQLETNNIAGDFDTIEAGMDASSLPFMLEMLSKSFYSNPIGSIVREITSNCFDSHIEAKVDEPVIIKIALDEEEYISFTDFGMGLSPDRIKKVYMKYFTSTKRDTNEQIGGFGLGSKTPLAYSDYFYITTIVDKIKYSYLFSKGATLPTLDLLSEEPTEDHNGTEIKIYIKNYQDKRLFINALKSQLCYFDNVYFDNCEIDNEYHIYETDLFKFRNIGSYSDEMHICFGKVSYPIDWEQIDEKPVSVSVGVKFNIDELIVTPNREALRYTNEVKELVKARVKATVEELKSMYLKQQKTHTDFFEWYKSKDSRKKILFNVDNPDGSEPDTLYLKGFDDLGKKHQLEILNELDLDASILKDDIYSVIYNRNFQIVNKKITKYKQSYKHCTDFLINNKHHCIFSKDSNFSGIKNYHHGSGVILQRRSTLSIFKYFLDKKGNYHFRKYVQKPKDYSMSNYNYDIGEHFNDEYFDLGYSMKIYKLIKYLREQVEPNIPNYHIEIDEDLKEEYKDYQKENDANLKRKLEGKVHVYDIGRGDDYDWKIQDIENYKGIVIYGFMADKNKLQKALTFAYLRPKFRSRIYNSEENGFLNDKACKVLRISQQNEKYFKNKPNMIHVKNLYGDNKLFRQLASSYKIEMLLGQYLKNYSEYKTESFINFIKEINEPISIIFKELYDYHRSFTTQEDIKYTRAVRKDLKLEILEVAKASNLFDPVIESKIKVIEDYFSGIELLKHIDFNDETLPIILKYLRDNKKKINLEYYCKFIEPEKLGTQLIIDFEPKEAETKFKIITEAA